MVIRCSDSFLVMSLISGYVTHFWLCDSFLVSDEGGVGPNRRKNGPAKAAKGAKRVSIE